MGERILVTGVLGCIGAWVAREALARGHMVVGLDLGDDRHRLELVAGEDAVRVVLVQGDVTDAEVLGWALDEHEITQVIHLAALQVPFVRDRPRLGMHVNVSGTVNVFESVADRVDRIPRVVYASSVAVYGPDTPSPAPERGGAPPATLYGVTKLADEGMARVYRADRGLASVGVRPFVVYGPGRDQGLTSGPTVAMRAAARGERATIGFTGEATYDYAPDVARILLASAASATDAATVHNLPGAVASVEEIVAGIVRCAPGAQISVEGPPLPFPPRTEARSLVEVIGPFAPTPLADGIAATIEHFRRAG